MREKEDLAPAAQPGGAEAAPAEPAATPPEATSGSSAGALVEPPEEAVGRLEAELAELKDKYLRLAAEFDNFRKRALKERAELWGRAQIDLLQRLVDALDDLARVAHVDPAQTEVKAIQAGVDLVERKISKELDSLGVRRIDQAGVPFDPNLHEAVTTQPAAAAAQDHTVAAVLQAGYQVNGALIRPARVVVLTWQGEPG